MTRYILRMVAFLLGLFLVSSVLASQQGDNLWTIRHNGDDRFHSNEAWLRPWRSQQDDGWGRWVGNYSYEVPWYNGPYTQPSGSAGSFRWSIGHGSS